MRDIVIDVDEVQSIASKLNSGELLSDDEQQALAQLLNGVVEASKEERTDLVVKWGKSATYTPMLLMFPADWRDIEIAMVHDVSRRFARWIDQISVRDGHYRMTGESVDALVKTDNMQASYEGHEISGLFWQLSMKFKNYK